ncbi:hypothetical protein RHSIM_Rhsim04G0138300 [Rhododendron simsii]|uniref:Uncharacterized protein n=1 Tax=Rhododendron simsii TaxID=118357 RepID=A0A834H6A5_RHOSS|nr:hypothetical protein RHSIM_Rhsim04G0138300 [Rhododendron simsii]
MLRLKRATNKPPRVPIPNVASTSRQPGIEEGDEILKDIEEEEEMMENPEQGAQVGSRRKRTSEKVKADKQASYLTTIPPERAKQSVWQKLLFCQGVPTMNSHRKLKREIRENARRQQRIDHKLDYVLGRQERSVSEPYVPPPDEEVEDSDDFAGEEPKSGDEE